MEEFLLLDISLVSLHLAIKEYVGSDPLALWSTKRASKRLYYLAGKKVVPWCLPDQLLQRCPTPGTRDVVSYLGRAKGLNGGLWQRSGPEVEQVASLSTFKFMPSVCCLKCLPTYVTGGTPGAAQPTTLLHCTR